MRSIISISQNATLKRKLSHLFKGGVEDGGKGGGLLSRSCPQTVEAAAGFATGRQGSKEPFSLPATLNQPQLQNFLSLGQEQGCFQGLFWCWGQKSLRTSQQGPIL